VEKRREESVTERGRAISQEDVEDGYSEDSSHDHQEKGDIIFRASLVGSTIY